MTRTARTLCVVFLAALLTASGDGLAAAQGSIIFATTTSTQDTGLLDVLVPRFEKESGVRVKVIAVGTGAALRMASTGDADVVLTHAPAAEREYVDAGHLVEGRRVMHNDFVIVGPPDDPAGVRSRKLVVDAMRAIAGRSVFISRGDDSGTHQQELALWTSAGIDPQSVKKREETGQGMGATLNIADQKRAYALTDRATYLALRKRLDLAIAFEGDPNLLNIYHVYVVNPAKHQRVNAAGARAFAQFLVSPEIQRMIGEFKRQEYGQPLFVPDARRPGLQVGRDPQETRRPGLQVGGDPQETRRPGLQVGGDPQETRRPGLQVGCDPQETRRPDLQVGRHARRHARERR